MPSAKRREKKSDLDKVFSKLTQTADNTSQDEAGLDFLWRWVWHPHSRPLEIEAERPPNSIEDAGDSLGHCTMAGIFRISWRVWAPHMPHRLPSFRASFTGPQTGSNGAHNVRRVPEGVCLLDARGGLDPS